MAMLAPKTPFAGSLGSGAAIVPSAQSSNMAPPRRAPTLPTPSANLASPTQSEFSDGDSPDAVKNWGVDQVCDYLRTVKCGEYEKIFRKNHINGENLLEMDKEVLKEMGIEKVGDRVRLFLGIKKLRTRAYANQKKRNRDSFGGLDIQYIPSSGSPRPGRNMGPSSRQPYGSRPYDGSMDIARSESPSYTADPRRQRLNHGASRHPGSPAEPQSARLVTSHTRNNSSMDGSLMAGLPQGQDVIRVICTNGVTKVVKIADCSTCEEVMRVTLRKFALREDHERNYCFWVLDGLEPDPHSCRRLGDTELWRIIKDQKRLERNRLILRRVPAGAPGDAELQRAAAIAMEEAQQTRARALENTDKRSQVKLQKLLGEGWDEGLRQPGSAGRGGYSSSSAQGYDHSPVEESRPRARNRLLRQFGGLRPPSELITSDLTSYFPDHPREDIDRTARMSLRRSTRLSRHPGRAPIPTIADSWLNATNQSKNRPQNAMGRLQFRDSVASSMLDTLQEESPIDSTRKSFTSFADSSSDGASLSVTDPEGNTVMRRGFFDGSADSTGSGSFQDIKEALNEDGEDVDEELQSFLAGESWDDNKWMKGALIGQGSFGSVYLALHAITGELLAVKQVETPAPGANSQNDNRKKSMIEALKREISLCGISSTPTLCTLPEPLVRSFVRQIITGLSYLHGQDIIHRDIKGANILVDNKGTIKISDFGISKKLEASNILSGANNNKHRPSLQGSVFWMAPEVVKQTSHTRKADIWSLGCLVVEMMTGTHPFPDCTQLQAIFKIGGAKASPTIPEHASQEAKDFLAMTFEMDHEKRPGADELMLSPFWFPLLDLDILSGLNGREVGSGANRESAHSELRLMRARALLPHPCSLSPFFSSPCFYDFLHPRELYNLATA
ncbi:unnamed protein product [Parascedosporium putredinis]|uniref:mitogen-activated protein kinase n=1 Tax=Parascedosporium putredinis TaxID=1442378 RepID=A0A9P1MFN4_9PEZI|nr:unnamed protein product [Parascedosporium putredinis]CAI8003873.1 unnamed protein product [Parascedosporium putredinis]